MFVKMEKQKLSALLIYFGLVINF